MRNIFHRKHSWVYIGLRTVDRDPVEVEKQKRNAKPGVLVFTYKILYDYQQCRRCGKIRDKRT